MSVGGEFGRRVSGDELCAEVRQAVEGGDEDALRRLGFGGFGGYVQRLSEIMSDSVTDGLDLSADDFGAIMGEVASPARYAHHLVNEAGTAIQTAKDKPLGIHIKPLEPEFDDDALKGTVGTAANAKSPEQAVETLADGLSYAVKKAGNDFIKANAEQRSRAGFEVTVKRSGSSKCCEWCAARIGSWALKNAPDGVFGCHANCSCTVEYTSSTGAKTSARGANLHRYGAGAFVEVEYEPPHVMSAEEARAKGGFDEPKRLTGGGNGGIIGLYRKAHNIGEYSSLSVPMQKRYVDDIIDLLGLDYKGTKIQIVRDRDLIGSGFFGYTFPNAKIVQLYPDAFSDIETLVKTLGHERIHCEQYRLFGSPQSTDELGMFEKSAVFSEEYWWQLYQERSGR